MKSQRSGRTDGQAGDNRTATLTLGGAPLVHGHWHKPDSPGMPRSAASTASQSLLASQVQPAVLRNLTPHERF